MAKRTHSESLLEEASNLIENAVSSKKQRTESKSDASTESVVSSKKSEKYKKGKLDREAKRAKKAAANSGTPASLEDVESAGKARKQEKRRKRKEREAVAQAAQGADPLASTDIADKDEKEAMPKQEKSEKKAKDGKKSKARKTESDAVASSGDFVALFSETIREAPRPAPAPTTAVSSVIGPYEQNSALTQAPQKEIDDFLTSQFIAISDPLNAGYRPITNFSYLPAGYEGQHEMFKTFTSPSPIQAAAWPFLLAGRDAIGVAETGSGKTLAFGLPCIRYVTSQKSKKGKGGVRAVIVSPTRELALQIYEQLQKLAVGTSAKVVCIYGGVPKDEQRNGLRTASIIVATPGRLNDFLQEGAADLTSVGYVVLDEADRMLDKGFEVEIRKIISTVPTSTCQTLMFTATWPQSIRELASTFMKDPVKITIGDNPNGDLRANVRVKQLVEVVDPRGKEQRLLQLLRQYQSGAHKAVRILVFCLYKKEATRIEGFIRSKGFKVAGIHGDLGQAQRTASLEAFKSGEVPLLVATDVAARGLDIPSVMLVINVTFPLTAEDYVHRIGRTGRAGKEGLAITLFTEHDKAQSGPLINVLKAAKQEVPEELMKFGTTVKKKAHDAYGSFYRETDDTKKASKITFD